jgi:diketogulonate reductase-like aldo/keto reductase
LPRNRALVALARDLGASAAQLALAWLLRRPDVIAIPMSADPAHVRVIAAARSLRLSVATLQRLDALFPPPSQPSPLAMI